MPTSGTYTYNPDTLDLVDDAYERCGIDPTTTGPGWYGTGCW